MPEEEFARRVELLAVLTENFATRRASLLAQFAASAGNDNGCAGACVDLSQDAAPDNGTLPPLAKRALEHIDAHLTDPDLSVSRIAQALNVSSTYLAHIFATHTGVRMSRLIAERRVEMAKRLLATTDREVKQIAFSVGFSNAAWFSQVFRNRTGQTPGQYRRTQRPA